MSPYIALGLLLSLAALAFVLYPILRPRAGREPAPEAPGEPEERRRAIYRQILEIELDQQIGKLDPRHAQEATSALLHQAAALLGAQSSAERDLERAIELEIAALRGALAAARESELERV